MARRALLVERDRARSTVSGMLAFAAMPPPATAGGDPTWYLVWDLIIGGFGIVVTVAALVWAICVALRERKARKVSDDLARKADARADSAEQRELERYRAEEARARVEQEKAERAQAEQVRVSVTSGVGYKVENTSTLPIRHVQVSAYYAEDTIRRTERLPVIQAEQGAMLSVRAWQPNSFMFDLARFAVVFLDADGRRWAIFGSDAIPTRLPIDPEEAQRHVDERVCSELVNMLEFEAEKRRDGPNSGRQ